ncbi:aquaporin-like protein [Coprinellus micaceus]|uniref:Aquaporin-like protein n=1 Tax=Coprinellus micaceus TaxID=71717 RepID=A0A4Y7TFR4_COPMI|nr:aquaporin-like protein [Coprinellus micaceus]
MFGCGANAQFGLTSDPNVRALGPAGNWMTLSFGWGAGLAMGIWISGGGHLNPAVTLSMAVFRGFPWHRLPIFWLCQILGGVVGAAIVYGNYVRAIDIFEGGRHVRTLATAGYFGTVPLPYVTNLECFFSEFTATALLVMGIFALFDQATHGTHLGIVPIGIFILFTGIAVAFGAQTSFAANPARDFGPRVFTAMVGYGRQAFTFRNWYFLYSPILGGLTGGLLGAALYDIFLYGDRLNVINKLVMLRLGVVAREKKDAGKV